MKGQQDLWNHNRVQVPMNLFFYSGPCCLSSIFLMEEHHCAKITMMENRSTGTLNFMFTNILFLLCPKGKEYVCIVRLHEAIENESELAKVGTLNLNFILRILQLIFKMKISIPSVLFAVKHTRLQPWKCVSSHLETGMFLTFM